MLEREEEDTTFTSKGARAGRIESTEDGDARAWRGGMGDAMLKMQGEN